MFLSGSGCALRGWAEGPARKPGGSKNRKSADNSSAQRGGKTENGFPPKTRPSSPIRACLTAAPLSLRRCRSAPERWPGLLHKRRPRQFLPDWLTANRQNMPS